MSALPAVHGRNSSPEEDVNQPPSPKISHLPSPTLNSTVSVHSSSRTDCASTQNSPIHPSSATETKNDYNYVNHLIDDLKRSRVAFYAATPNLVSHADFFLCGSGGDVAVVKKERQDITELLLSGIFKIDCQLFFMNADGGFSMSNLFNRDFVDTKLTCHLIPVQNDATFSTAQNDFDAIIANVKALERLIPLKKGESLNSCIKESAGKPCIRISHSLFVVSIPLHLLFKLTLIFIVL